MKSLVTCKNLSFYYRNASELALKNVTFSINDKDFIALIGPNGGGKTTLVKLILGLLKPTDGEILYDQGISSNIGYVPQNTSINMDFPIKVIDVVSMGFLRPKFFGFRLKSEQRDRAFELLSELGIEHLANKKIGDLSGGQRQRALIARALCSNSKLIILDEPTSNIDQETQKNVYKLLKKYNATHTIVLISHDMSILMGYASRVMFVNQEVVLHDDLDFNQVSDFDGHLCPADILNRFIKDEYAK